MDIPIDATATGLTDRELIARELAKPEYAGLDDAAAAQLVNAPVNLATGYRLATADDLWAQDGYLMADDATMAAPLRVIARLGGIDVTPGGTGAAMLAAIDAEACASVQAACMETVTGPVWLTWGWSPSHLPIDAAAIAWVRGADGVASPEPTEEAMA